jgi:aspartate aminotransferase-like enzyme
MFLQASCEGLGLTLCTKEHKWKSDTVTAVVVPSWLDSGEVVKIAYKKYNLSLGVGLNKIAGKVFRIGHLGNVNEVCSHKIKNLPEDIFFLNSEVIQCLI